MLSLAHVGLASAAVGPAVAWDELSRAINTTVARGHDFLERTGAVYAKRRRNQRHRRRRPAPFSAARQRMEVESAGAPPPPLLVLGIISNPRTPHTRDWIRATYLSTPAARSSEVVIRFVIGARGLSASDRSALEAEHGRARDLEHIDASDFAERGGIFSCIDKLFAWFPHAATRWPASTFYAKADDDSYVDVGRLLPLLRPWADARYAYLGYVQYDSFITDEWKHCGWAAGPVGAVSAHAHGCPGGGRAAGPFPFVVGALTAMGADLARWMRDSDAAARLVRDGRASQSRRRRHWDCGYSDVTLGYALATLTANLSISLVSVVDAMRDATYGAMAASKFVVSHHLRTRAQFDAAHAEATASPGWAPRVSACVPWGEAAAGRLSDGGGSSSEVRRAMEAFGCCQRWKLCEVSPS